MAEKILVADDERHIVEGLQMLLADDGFESTRRRTGRWRGSW
jgi:DNA-binding response OmpR family regulator